MKTKLSYLLVAQCSAYVSFAGRVVGIKTISTAPGNRFPNGFHAL